MTRLVPSAGRLTLDDLERLAFTYGGEIQQDLATNQCRLVGAVVAGRRITLGPVPGPVAVEVA